MGVSHVYPIIDFTQLDYVKIPVGAYLIGFDTSNGGKLCKMDHFGVITVIEGTGTVTTNGHIIQDEGTSLIQRLNLNFIGQGVTATDNPLMNSTDITFSGGSTLKYFIQEDVPTDLPEIIDNGDRWFNLTTGSEFVWINDGTSAAWVEIPANGIGGIQYYVSDTPPPITPGVGDKWLDTTTGIELTWIDDGTSAAWVELN